MDKELSRAKENQGNGMEGIRKAEQIRNCFFCGEKVKGEGNVCDNQVCQATAKNL